MTGSDGWRVAAETRDLLGEGPLWIAAETSIYWVDVFGPAINRLSLIDGSMRRWAMPEMISFIVPRRDHPGFVAGLRSGFCKLRLDPFACEPIGDPEPDLPENRLNDGKVDLAGRLWAGTMPMAGDTATGTLYRLDPDLRWHGLDGGYHVTNGPAFAPAQDYLYHADSPRRVVYRFCLDGAGALRDKRPFVRFPEDWGYPDGMTVDAEGYLWVAHWNGGRLSRFDPDGVLDRAILLPASKITSCTFAGIALDRMFVTSAREGCEDEPLAGALFEVDPGVTGLSPGFFAG